METVGKNEKKSAQPIFTSKEQPFFSEKMSYACMSYLFKREKNEHYMILMLCQLLFTQNKIQQVNN